MKKYITYLLATALVGSAFVSCTERLQEGEMRISTHKVHFAASDMETRTGLSIDGTTVTPDWNKTALESIHLFEIDANDAVAYGETIAITPSEDNATAHFEADFPTDMSIIVDPSDPEEDSGAKDASNGATNGTRVSPYRYAAIIAQKPDNNNLTFVVPSEQHPDAKTLKDPDADFLIGYSRKAYDTEHFFDEPVVDLYFDRVAALGRLAISNFAEGEKVQSVTINAQNGLTGSASYANIDFENGKANFVREEGPGAITLVYDGGMDIPADGPFYAYFVAIPGPATLTSVEVVTDQYRYTKTIEGGKELTFSEKAFKSMNLDLSTATREEVAPSGLTWYKASMLEAGYDYLIVSGGQALKNNGSEVAALAVEPQDGVITFEGDVDPAIIWTATAYSGLEEFGHFTLSNGAKYLYRYSDTSTQLVKIGDLPDDVTKHYVWDYDGTYLYHVSSAADSRTYYCWYDGGWKTSNTGQMATALYTNRPPQSISFTAPGPFEYDLDDPTVDFEEPALSEHIGDVTYSSSDESIATVDPETGNVTFLKAGVVEIIATAAGDDSHQAATASYMIVVTSSQIPTWYKAEEIVAGETYLVISHDYALDNNGTSGGSAVHLEGVGETIQYDAPETMIWTATNENSGKFRLTGSDGKVIRLSNNAFQINTASGTESNNQWSLDANGLLKSGNYFLYYSTSQEKWAVSSSASDSHTGYLYASSPALQPRNLAFSATSVTHDLATQGTDVQEPTLSGVTEGVEYSSSNTSIATVNATTGEVSLTGKTGSAVITASAQKTDSYKAEEVSYDLIVKDSSAPSKTYKKITSTSQLTVGAKYLLVYESTPSVFKPILNGSTFKKTTDNVLSVTISNHSITSAELADCELTLAEGYYLHVASADRYVYPLFDGNQTTTLEAESSPSHNLTVTINSDGTAKITNAASTASSFTWSTRSNYFSSTTSATATINVCLYKEDDGSNPGGGDDPTPTGTTYYPASSIVAGQQYLIVSNGKALQNGGGSAAALDVTVASGTITMDAPASALWTAQEDGEAFDFINNSQYLRRPSNGTTAGIGSKSSTADNNQWYYDADNQRLTVKHTSSSSGNTTTYYLRYNTSWEISTTAGNAVLYTTDPGSNPGGGDDPTPSTSTYTLISGDANLVTGTYLIVDKTDTYLFNASGSNNGGYSNLGSTSGITKSGSTITLTDEIASASEFVLTRSGNNLTIKQVGGTHSGKYMYASANVSNSYIDFQTAENNFTINSQTGDLVYFSTTKGSSNSEYLYKKAADSYFKLGGSGAPGGGDAGVYLYKKADNP